MSGARPCETQEDGEKQLIKRTRVVANKKLFSLTLFRSWYGLDFQGKWVIISVNDPSICKEDVHYY